MASGRTIHLEQLLTVDYNDERLCALQRFWAVVSFMAEGRFSALHAFYHEEDACVRVCAWPYVWNDQRYWTELAPLMPSGVEVLLAVRRHLSGQKHSEERRRVLRFVLQDWRKTLLLWSPHAWDVRVLDTECDPPANLPYVLVFRSVWESRGDPGDDGGSLDRWGAEPGGATQRDPW